MSPSRWIVTGALVGAIGVGLGAFGAHVLGDLLARLGYSGEDAIRRMANHETAVRYQMWHALAIVFVGLALTVRPSAAWNAAGWAFLFGVLVFCGFLYALVVVGPNFRWFGMIVPFGGVSLIVGWVLLAIGAWGMPDRLAD
jgi:uncharacterized membrane protein YgdD (TMEM256/DUF423 family)